jgi:hypothetical protein
MEEAPIVAAGTIEPRTVDASRGVAWWSEAWALFMRSGPLWVLLGVILIIAFMLIGMVPLLGSLATALLTPVFFAGWLVAARKVEGGGPLELADLFTCFQGERLTPLMVLGALFAAATLVALLVAGVLGAGAMFGLLGTMHGGMHQGAGGMMAAMGAGLLGLLFFLLFGLLATAALWFAPALVVFRNVPPVEAVMTSLRAVFKNVLPFLIYGVIQLVLAVVASIPFGLGWLVLLPVMLLTAYVSYRDVFGEPVPAAAT